MFHQANAIIHKDSLEIGKLRDSGFEARNPIIGSLEPWVNIKDLDISPTIIWKDSLKSRCKVREMAPLYFLFSNDYYMIKVCSSFIVVLKIWFEHSREIDIVRALTILHLSSRCGLLGLPTTCYPEWKNVWRETNFILGRVLFRKRILVLRIWTSQII